MSPSRTTPLPQHPNRPILSGRVADSPTLPEGTSGGVAVVSHVRRMPELCGIWDYDCGVETNVVRSQGPKEASKALKSQRGLNVDLGDEKDVGEGDPTVQYTWALRDRAFKFVSFGTV